LKPGDKFAVVLDVLAKDIPVEVPEPFVAPKGAVAMGELITLWNRERSTLYDLLEKVTAETVKDFMFSHPAAGPLDPVRTLQLAVAHSDAHRRQIDRLREELETNVEKNRIRRSICALGYVYGFVWG
jgi:hypothetical protein